MLMVQHPKRMKIWFPAPAGEALGMGGFSAQVDKTHQVLEKA